jgi:hypothetical protein
LAKRQLHAVNALITSRLANATGARSRLIFRDFR